MEAALRGAWPIPFILDPYHLGLDATIAFIVSALLAIMINAEGQAWVSTMLGDVRVGAKDRFHFNAFFHLDVTGCICYLVAGFGWPKNMDIDPSKFKNPELYMVLSRAAGPMANLLMASVAATLVFLMQFIFTRFVSIAWWMLPLLFILYYVIYLFAILLTISFDQEDIAMLLAIEKKAGVNAAQIKKILSRFL